MDRYLEKHISPHTLTSNVKVNPLFPAAASTEEEEEGGAKVQPSWTVEEYNARTCAPLAEHVKVRGHGGGRSTWTPAGPEVTAGRLTLNDLEPVNVLMWRAADVGDGKVCLFHRGDRELPKIWTSGWRTFTRQDSTPC